MFKEIAEKAIKNNVFPGCVVGSLYAGKRSIEAYGTVDGSEKTHEKCVYDCASVTKSVVTTTLAFQLIDENIIALDGLVNEYLPEFVNAQSRVTTIRHLLSYAVGGYALSPLVRLGAQEITNYVLTKDFDGNPGEKIRYANMPLFLLGLVLEKVTRTSIEQLAKNRIFFPLTMHHSSMMKSISGEQVAPTEEGVCGVVHDESARVFAREGRAVGHAGLFSTAGDLLLFCENILAHEPREEWIQGLGWEKGALWMGNAFSQRAIGKTGFTGTSIYIDYEDKTAVVVLSNRTYPRRPKSDLAITEIRKEFVNKIYARST